MSPLGSFHVDGADRIVAAHLDGRVVAATASGAVWLGDATGRAHLTRRLPDVVTAVEIEGATVAAGCADGTVVVGDRELRVGTGVVEVRGATVLDETGGLWCLDDTKRPTGRVPVPDVRIEEDAVRVDGTLWSAATFAALTRRHEFGDGLITAFIGPLRTLLTDGARWAELPPSSCTGEATVVFDRSGPTLRRLPAGGRRVRGAARTADGRIVARILPVLPDGDRPTDTWATAATRWGDWAVACDLRGRLSRFSTAESRPLDLSAFGVVALDEDHLLACAEAGGGAVIGPNWSVVERIDTAHRIVGARRCGDALLCWTVDGQVTWFPWRYA